MTVPPTVPPPTLFVLFGATGDLARRMVLPAFFTLFREGLLPERFRLIGYTNDDVPEFDLAARVKSALKESGTAYTSAEFDRFARQLRFAYGEIDDGGEHGLLATVASVQGELGVDIAPVHYLAVPPQQFEAITRGLGRTGLNVGARVIYEKPFGTSLAAFRSLNRIVREVLDERQVYRIDHFLGKQATRQLHTMRFANAMFDSIWNNRQIRSVQIDVPEQIGVKDRSRFYDATGAVLDMLVTHLLQVAAEIAMEPPQSIAAEHLSAARAQVIEHFRPIDPVEAVRGQFGGYKQLADVERESTCETYVACRMWVDTPRWRGVPFLLRTGKRLALSEQRVTLILRDPAGPLSGLLPHEGNAVSLSLKGDGKIILRLTVERPAAALALATTAAEIDLGTLSGADPLPPYARLIHDALCGDRSLFTRPDGLAAAWKVVAPLLDLRQQTPQTYRQGSWGPAAAQALAAPDGWLLGQ